MGETGGSFARWYYARGKGQRYLLCLIPVVATIVAMKLLIPIPDKQPEGTIAVPCPPLGEVYISLDEPFFKGRDLDTIGQLECMPAR